MVLGEQLLHVAECLQRGVGGGGVGEEKTTGGRRGKEAQGGG